MKPTKEYNGRSRIRMYNCDCMELMKTGSWDLAVVDPPYGIGASNDQRFGTKTKKAGSKRNDYTKKKWDLYIPHSKYFKLIKSVSKNQIIWGANYFNLKGGRLFWHKNQTSYTSSNGELAYLSMKNGIDYIDLLWHGAYQFDMKNKEHRIHPTQKPVKLYKYLLTNYAKEGDTILDTHGGSLSIAIACWDLGFDLDVCELDSDYFNDAVKRFEQHVAQGQLF